VNSDRWQQIKQVFNDALQREPAQRAPFLAAACGGDSDLRAEVEKLLNSYETGFMAQPAVGEVAELVVGAPQQLQAGQRLGRYRIVQPIGAGGMGEVYLAHDTELERDVALKILTGEVAADQQRMQRFVQEAKMASALNHQNIITIYEVGQADGRALHRHRVHQRRDAAPTNETRAFVSA
jgi:eukaryotic-like serine/threonine-protein kinase